jgi:uncharacterized membrane protein
MADGWDGHTVLVVSFADDRTANQGLTSLTELDSEQRVLVRDAVVVVRDEDGQVVVKERLESTDPLATAGGGLIGLLIGIIGGPLGVVVGGITGLIVGSLVDMHAIDDADSALTAISSSVRLGQTALLAVVDEQTPEVVDAAMSDLDGIVIRRPVADVKAEIAAADRAQHIAKREARKELVREDRQHDKAAVHARLEELKAKLPHPRQTETDDTATGAGSAR